MAMTRAEYEEIVNRTLAMTEDEIAVTLDNIPDRDLFMQFARRFSYMRDKISANEEANRMVDNKYSRIRSLGMYDWNKEDKDD